MKINNRVRWYISLPSLKRNPDSYHAITPVFPLQRNIASGREPAQLSYTEEKKFYV